MAPSVILLAIGVGSGLIGAATATDVVSLRAVAHAVDVPLVSAVVIGLREAMPTGLAHLLEPAAGVFGGVLAAGTLLRATRARGANVVRRRPGALRTVLALALLRTS